MDIRVIDYISRAGFFTYSQLRWVRLDWAVLTALIDRWMLEISTFHLRVGMMTAILQDVAVLLDLRIYSSPITGSDDRGVLQTVGCRVPDCYDFISF